MLPRAFLFLIIANEWSNPSLWLLNKSFLQTMLTDFLMCEKWAHRSGQFRLLLLLLLLLLLRVVLDGLT